MNLGAEDEKREFKESLVQLDSGLRSLSAMLNRHGSGCVYFGVRDNGDVIGTSVGRDTFNKIRHRISELIQPKIIADIAAEEDENGNTCIRVSAKGGNIPYSCDGRYFIRSVASDEKVSNELLRKMLISNEMDLARSRPSDIQDLTFSQLCTFMIARGLHVSDNESLYSSYGLRTEDGLFNIMALLLSDQSSFSVKVVRFSGKDKAIMSERTEYGRQCLLVSLEQVLQHLKAVNTTKVNLAGGRRSETELFDFESFREAWINACLHNSWAELLPPSVFIFDDRIEIVSYGGLPYGLSEEDFYKGKSVPVNKALMTVFALTGFAEQSGHGVPIIVARYGRKAFSFSSGMLTVTIPFSFEPDIVYLRRRTGSGGIRSLSENQFRVLRYLAENPTSTLDAAAREEKLSLAWTKKIVALLQQKSLLSRTGSRKTGAWKVRQDILEQLDRE